jgi:thiol-disulfide isomerase/thioredoxin
MYHYHLIFTLTLMFSTVTGVNADDPKQPAAKDQTGYQVKFNPGEARSPHSPRFSPYGYKLKVAASEAKLDGFDILAGHILLGPKETQGKGHTFAIARSEKSKPYDMLYIDSNFDGSLTDEKAIRCKPNANRDKWWSSFDCSVKVKHASKGQPDQVMDFPFSFWVVVDKPDELPSEARYSRRGFLHGVVTIDEIEYNVAVSDGNNDAMISTGDYWVIARVVGEEPLAKRDWRKMPDFCWGGGKAWKLVMDGTSGTSGKLFSFTPDVSQEDDEAKRDVYKVDRDAPRAEKPATFETDYEAALKKAAESKKPIFVKFETTWCGPCMIMNKLVFTSKAVAEAAEGVILVKVDGDKRKDLAEKYKIVGYPNAVILDANGKEIGRAGGYKGVKEMAELLTKLKK